MSEVYEELQNKNYLIAVPSRGRSFMIPKRTGIWKHLYPDRTTIESGYNTALIVRHKEAFSYREYYNGTVMPMENNVNIADKRKRALSFAAKSQIEWLFIVDDDVSFYYRNENFGSKYSALHEEIVKRDIFNKILYESIMLCNEKFPLIGIPLKQGSFKLKYTFRKNAPIIRFVCYHVPTLKKESIDVTGLGTPFMSDRFVQLSLLSKGYRSLSNCRFCVGDSGTGYRGGCSETRTVLNQSQSAIRLHKTFTDYVSLKYKTNGLWNEARYDCKIDWGKFFNEGEQPFLPKEEGLKIIQREGVIYEI